VPADLVRWQQPCAGWCAATVSSICGQERQFPQNNATMISAAINELETLRIVIPFYTTFPPPQHPQRAQRVPTARLAEVLQFKKGPAGITILEHPSAVVFPPDFDQLDGFFQPPVGVPSGPCAAVPKVVEPAQDVVVPARREGEARHLALHDVTGPMRPEQPVSQQKLAAARLSVANRARLPEPLVFEQP
jgi:hypothetical protein